MTFSNPIVSFIGGLCVMAIAWFLKEWLAPDLLDRSKQARAARIQVEAEARAHEREDAPLRERIGSLVKSLCDGLYRGAFLHGEFTFDDWKHWHAELTKLIDSPEGSRALGAHFRIFADALKHDSLSTRIQSKHSNEFGAGALGDLVEGRQSRYESLRYRALFEQVAAGVLASWVAPLRAIGFDEDAARYEKAAIEHERLAQETLERGTPF